MSQTKPTILVLAAAGSTGMQVCLQLLEQGFTVKAFVRKEDARSVKLRSFGATVFVGSLTDIDDMREAMKGCSRAYFCAPMTDAYLRNATVFATVARETKLETVVVMSQWLSSPQHPAVQTRECWLSDQVFSMLPETDVITVNPGFFADNELQAINLTAIFGTFMIPYGNGLNAAPSNEDMARVISALLMQPAGHAGKTYRITGPKLLSPTEIATILGKILGRRVRYIQPPNWMIAKVLQGFGYDGYVIAQFLEYVKEYQRGTFAIGGPTDAVLRITGRPAEDYETTARRYADRLPKNVRSLPSMLKALVQMTLWMMRPAPELERHLSLSDFASADRPSLSIDNPSWLESHGKPLANPGHSGSKQSRSPQLVNERAGA